MSPISLLCFGLCFLLLPHQPGITSWHLSAFWSRPLLVSERIVQWKSACAQREKRKSFLLWNLPKFPRKFFCQGEVHILFQRRQLGFKTVFEVPWLSDCRVLDRDVGMALHQGTAELCPGFVSRNARSALLGVLVGGWCLHAAVKEILVPALHKTPAKIPSKEVQFLQRNQEQGTPEELTWFPSLKHSNI